MNMFIKKILDQNRRDLSVIYSCEHCNYEFEGSGYDDTYFHNTVIPEMQCPRCGKIAGDYYKPLTPKYRDYQII